MGLEENFRLLSSNARRSDQTFKQISITKVLSVQLKLIVAHLRLRSRKAIKDVINN